MEEDAEFKDCDGEMTITEQGFRVGGSRRGDSEGTAACEAARASFNAGRSERRSTCGGDAAAGRKRRTSIANRRDAKANGRLRGKDEANSGGEAGGTEKGWGSGGGSSGPRPSGGGEPCTDSAADAESLLVARRHEDDAAWLAYKQDVRAFEAHVEHLLLDALPEFTPGKAQLGVLGDLQYVLRCWMTEGAFVRVTLLTMHTKVRKEAAAVLYKLLGDILPKFKLDLSDSSTVLPRQVMLLMFKAFDMSRDRYNRDEEARIKSQKVYAAMKAAQRKRPAEQTLKRVCDRQKDPDAKLAIAKK